MRTITDYKSVVVLGALVLGIWSLGCSDKTSNDTSENRNNENQGVDFGPVEQYPQREGDPVAGYEAFMNQDYVSCGIPVTLYDQFFGTEPSTYRIADRKGRNADLPFAFTMATTPNGVNVVSSNCMTCHATVVNGEVIVGLGNTTQDYTQTDTVRLLGGARAMLSDLDEREELDRFVERMTTIAPYVTTDTVGINPADNLTAALLAYRDPLTMQWLDEPQVDLEYYKTIVPVRVPPFWWMNKKHAMFYTTLGRGSHTGYMMAASVLCADSVEELEVIDSYFNDVRAYISSIEPPAYPFDIDNSRAEQGQRLFEENCSVCHGTYGDNPQYPNLVVSVDEVGTDPMLAEYATEHFDHFYEWFKNSYYGRESVPNAVRGYMAPPLNGIWAISPYFHNGSVPTLEAVLNSTIRPTYWMRESLAQNYENYNDDALGWRFVALDYSKDDAETWEIKKMIYDTTREGYSNKGHYFGDHFTADERRAVLEYLKTL